MTFFLGSGASGPYGSGGRPSAHQFRRLLLTVGVLLMGLGLVMLPETPWWHRHFDPAFEVVSVKNGDAVGTLGFASHFAVDQLTSYRVGGAQGLDIPLSVIEYRNEAGKVENVTVYPDQKSGGSALASNPRMNLWVTAAEAILRHASPEALYLTWWDNAQRIHFLTGENTSPRLPAAESLSDQTLSDFWKIAAGGISENPEASRQLAKWLTMDAARALPLIQSQLKSANPLYLLACVDDLARLGEIERLSGVSIPLDVRYFPAGEDLHAQIKAVRRWASEGGDEANYLVQPVIGGGLRAWRVTRPEASNLLLIRLLPFSKSLEHPLEGTRMVYQSLWGGYITIHEVLSALP